MTSTRVHLSRPLGRKSELIDQLLTSYVEYEYSSINILMSAKSFLLMFLVIILPLVLSIPEPKRHTIGQLSNLLTYFAQHRR